MVVTKEDLFDPVYFQVGYLGQIPHKMQIKVLRSKQKYKVIYCGRRAGKTQMVAGEIIRGAVTRLFKKQFVCAPIYKQSMIVYDKIINLLIKAKKITDVESYVVTPRPKITFLNGSTVEFGSADKPDSLRGEAYDRIFLDEAAFIKEAAIKVIRPFTFDTGAPVWMTSTPWGDYGYFYECYVRAKNGDEDYGLFHYNYKDNPYLSPEGVREIEKEIEEYGEDSVYVQTEIFGNFVSSVDKYFNQELLMKCVEEYPMLEVLG